jgi:hypothetical protein
MGIGLNDQGLSVRQATKATAAALLVVVGITAQAAEPTTLTLACTGTTTTRIGGGPPKEEPFSMGVTVDFTDRTIAAGFKPRFGVFRGKINSIINERTADFSAMDKNGDGVSGTIDRVTGDLEAISVVGNWTIRYALHCEPKQRKF